MTCPICNKETEAKYRPFCSKHCADVDLGRWFSGAYAAPVAADEEGNTTKTGAENLTPKPH